MLNTRRSKIFFILIAISIGLFGIWLMVFKLILPGIWNFLFVDEAPRQSDAIIVLSGNKGRLEYGIELYRADYAKYILFAGGGAPSMKRQAISLGIEEDRILTDSRSTSTFENAKNSAEIMQAHELKSAIIVTSGYHTKRAGIIFDDFFPRSDLTICAVPDGPTQDNWWRDGETVVAVISEYLKCLYHYLFER